jgi:hypothetical protein
MRARQSVADASAGDGGDGGGADEGDDEQAAASDAAKTSARGDIARPCCNAGATRIPATARG